MIALLLMACGAEPRTEPPVDPTAPDALDIVALYETESDGALDAKILPDVQEVTFQSGGRAKGDLVPVGATPLVDRSGSFDLAQLVGPDGTAQAAVVAFMASWCGPCEASLPTLAALERQWGDEVAFVIYDIDVNEIGQRKMLERARQAGVSAPVVLAPPYIQQAWLGSSQSVPRFFFVNRSGEILVQDRGFDDDIAQLMPRQLLYALNNPVYGRR